MTRAALLLALAGAFAPACSTPCAMLVERFCACDQSKERNRRACETGADAEKRRRAERIARQTGVEPQNVCKEALRAFRCPE